MIIGTKPLSGSSRKFERSATENESNSRSRRNRSLAMHMAADETAAVAEK
jgi:hypothetical protein